MGIPYAEVIGDPIAHSKSPLIHKFWLGKLGIEGDYRATQVTANELPAYLDRRRFDPDWRGCNLTMPLKRQAMSLVDKLDRFASGCGAINLVIASGGRLSGANSDASGFTEALNEGPQQPLPKHHVATYFHLIGAGGAARAIASAIRGTDIEFFNRTKAKADELADRFGAGSALGYSMGLEALTGYFSDSIGDEGDKEQRYSYILVNASAMGMRGYPPVPIRLELYPANTLVFDLVYDPVETSLLRKARELGMPTIDGLDMLVAQARSAFSSLFGAEPPREYDAELRELLIR
ncbi:MAG: shikimate dehydrogenase family protein [Sphingosinicella sp.]|uniref:shikimate dehydrogenase family protein n=1 Tax=Sphingosinicella sp. TaxID=1917971 RepID=UPI0040383314